MTINLEVHWGYRVLTHIHISILYVGWSPMTPTSQSFAILMQITVDNLSSFKEMPQGIAGYPLELVFLDVNVLKSVVKEIR